MIIGMGCLTLCDLLIKIASQTLPLGQAMITKELWARRKMIELQLRYAGVID